MERGTEQNAPPDRAVIGVLMFATIATLFFVPVEFDVFLRDRAKRHVVARSVAAPARRAGRVDAVLRGGRPGSARC